MFHRFTQSRSLLIEINPHQILVAGITRQRRGPVVIDCAAEFARGNTAGLQQWIEGRKELRKKWMGAVCGFVARKGILQRETLRAADLSDPGGLIAAIRNRQTLRFSVSSAPFQHVTPDQWTFRGVNALDGSALPEGDATRPALLIGLANDELHEVQQQLLDCRLMPQMVGPALLPLFGSIYQHMERRNQPRAAVVFVIKHDTTSVYILGKEGVHTPGHVTQGLDTLVQQVRKDFALDSDQAAMERLTNPDDMLRKRMPKFLRQLGAELRPVINSYEMTTGQPAGEVYCAYLPPELAWIAEPLIKVIDHEPMPIDCREWMPTVGLAPAADLPTFGPHWFGALSLAANLPEATGADTEITQAESELFARPWHPDCRLSVEASGSRFALRRMLAVGTACALLLVTLAAAGWQWQVTRTLRADTADWEAQMVANQKLMDDLAGALAGLQADSARLREAHGLMREPGQVTEFLMNLGRTLPPRMRIDRIDATDSRVLLTGSLLEPAEEASRSLGRYMETLRGTPAIGGLFASISATSLQREGGTDTLMFEVTMKLNPPPS